MQNDIYERIRANPKYQRLVQERGRFCWILTILMLIVYYGEPRSTPVFRGIWGKTGSS